MSLAGLMTYTVTLQRYLAVGEDEYGDPVATFTSIGSSSAWIEQTESREELVGRDRVLADWLLILPVGTTLRAYDRVIHDGMTFEVVGTPGLVGAPDPSKRHLEARLRLVEG